VRAADADADACSITIVESIYVYHPTMILLGTPSLTTRSEFMFQLINTTTIFLEIFFQIIITILKKNLKCLFMRH
jgi:hypothetical protein